MSMIIAELERLYDAHAQALFAFVLNLTRSECDTRDVLQELFVRLARNPDSLRNMRKPREFLLRAAHNIAVDLVRRRAASDRTTDRLKDQAEGLFAPIADPDVAEIKNLTERALAQLPPEQRSVVHLKLWEGMTFDEIARTLDIPQNTAASRYRYGLDKLRDLLRPIYEEML